MASNYRITTIPGNSGLQVSTTDVKDEKDGGVKSPEWMVSIDADLKSTIEKFETFSELFGWHAESGRFTTGDASGQLHTSSTLTHSDLVIQIANGGYSTVLEGKMNKGVKIDKITIVRLGNIQDVKVKLQEIVYEVCRIQKFQQELDRIWLFITITKRTNTVFDYKQDGGAAGQTVTSVDYSKNAIS